MKRTCQFSWILLLLSAFLLMLTNSASVRAAPELTIGDYELVSTKRISRTVFEYTYKADVTNTGTDALDVSATLNVTAPGVTVLEGQLSFGDVAAGARVTSSDTFAIHQDRSYSFGVDSLDWTIQATTPLAPPTDPKIIEIGTGSDAIAINTQVYEGQVSLPLGASPAPDELRVQIGISDSSPISADGRFVIRLNAEATALLRVVDAEGNGYLMKLFPKAAEIATVNPIIDAKSTAIALLALQPGLITADPYLDAAILAILERLPETQALAEQIHQELQNGTFHFNQNLSAEVLSALSAANYALANVSLENLQATNFSHKLKAMLAQWLEAIFRPAFAKITFDDPCTDLATEQFEPTAGNRDDVCIGAEIASSPEKSKFYMSNPRTRWVFLTTDLTQFGGNEYHVIDLIPSRHFDFPGVADTLKEGFLTTYYVLDDIGDALIYGLQSTFRFGIGPEGDLNYEADDKLAARMDKRYGPAKHENSYSFLANGQWTLRTIGFAREQESGPPPELYGQSYFLTILTEVILPIIAVTMDLQSAQFFDGNAVDKIIPCGLANRSWITDAMDSAGRLAASGNVGELDLAEWMYDNLVSSSDAWSYYLCIVAPAAQASATAEDFKNRLIKSMFETKADWIGWISSGLDVGVNLVALLDTYFDPDLASLDTYYAVVGAGLVVNPPVDGQCGPVVGSGACTDSLDSVAGYLCAKGQLSGFSATPSGWDWSCLGQFGGADASCAAIKCVEPPVSEPTVNFSADPSFIVSGESVTLSWSSTDSTSCMGTGFSTVSATSGNAQVSPVDTTTYAVTCTGPGGTADSTATVTVTVPPPVGIWSITPASVSVTEGSTAIFTISRPDNRIAQTVYVSTVQNQGFTNNGDYVSKLNEPLTFAAGQAQQPVTVTINLNAGVEGEKTFGLIVQQSPTDSLDTYVAAARFTIVDDDTDTVPLIPLNDTGIDWCANDTTNNLACPVSSHPGQDGDHGRDALARAGQLQKVGGGAAGFDFTKLDANGNDLPASATSWDCVRDNHTGLIWEVKTTSGLRSMYHTYTWYNPDPTTNGGSSGVQNGGTCTDSACDTHAFVQAVNQQGLCGASDWRLPTRRELMSIVHNGRINLNPAIDTAYFPNTPSYSWFWSSSLYADYADYSGSAWLVGFDFGHVGSESQRYGNRVRLVRAGQ